MASTNDDPTSNPMPSPAARQRTRTEGGASASNPLRFLERSRGGSSSSSNTAAAAALNSWPAGFVPPQAAPLSRASTLQQSPRLPRHSSLAFLERLPRSTSVSSLVTGAGADAGLGSLSGGVVAAGASRGGFLPYPREAVDDTGSEDGDEEEDDNVCPSMLFSCFPCLACLRPDKRRRQSDRPLLDATNNLKNRSRSHTSLSTPLLTEHPPSPVDFPKDVKLIEVEVESARNVPSDQMGLLMKGFRAFEYCAGKLEYTPSGTGDDCTSYGARRIEGRLADVGGTYVSLRVTPVQEGVGEQTEHTSIATPPVGSPRWGPRETFTFFVTDDESAKVFLALCLVHRPARPPPTPQASTGEGTVSLPADSRAGDVVLGEGFVDVLGLFPVQHGTYTPGSLKGNSRRVAVAMRNPGDKRRNKCSVVLGLKCRRVNETIDTHEDRLYEYQRWTKIAGWSAADQQRNAVKWSTTNGGVFSDAFADVAPPARDNAEVVLPWCPFGGWEYSRETEEAAAFGQDAESAQGDGLERFAIGGKGVLWVEGSLTGYQAVRRRLWRRVYVDTGSSDAIEAKETVT